MLGLLGKTVRRVREEGLVDTFHWARFRLYEEWHERRLGIDSKGYIEADELGYVAPGYHYEPAYYRSIHQALAQVRLRPWEDVFLDYGAGMGRVVVAAARRPFKRVIGVEISPELAAAARRNVVRAGSRLRCRDVEILTQDATAYEPPADVTVVFLFNPFGPPVLDEVQERLRASLEAHPRRLTILYIYVVGRGDHFRRCGWARRRRDLPTGPPWSGVALAVYEAGPSS